MGLRIAFEFKRFKPIGLFNHTIILVSILSIFISALVPSHPTVLGGITGFYFSNYMGIKLGSMGIYLVLLGITALYLIVTFKISKLNVPSRKLAEKDIESGDESSQIDVEEIEADDSNVVTFSDQSTNDEESVESPSELTEKSPPLNENPEEAEILVSNDPTPTKEDDFQVKVEVHQDEEASKKELNQKVKDFGEYDPTLDLSRFRLPGIDLLQQYGDGQITFDKEEIENNKNNIVDTLRTAVLKSRRLRPPLAQRSRFMKLFQRQVYASQNQKIRRMILP